MFGGRDGDLLGDRITEIFRLRRTEGTLLPDSVTEALKEHLGRISDSTP